MTVAIKNNNKTPLVVPASVRRTAGFKSGQEIEFKASGGLITILPKVAADEEYTPAQRRKIDHAIAKGLEDIKHGRLEGPFSSHKEFIASLHEEVGKLGKKKPKRLVR